MNTPNERDVQIEYDTRRRQNEHIARMENICKDLEYKVQQMERDLLENICKDLEYKVQQLQRDMDFHRFTEGHPKDN